MQYPHSHDYNPSLASLVCPEGLSVGLNESNHADVDQILIGIIHSRLPDPSTLPCESLGPAKALRELALLQTPRRILQYAGRGTLYFAHIEKVHV